MSNNDEIINDLFDHACDALKQLTLLSPFPAHWPTIPISNRLLTYAYFKQATKGDCKQPQPQWWDSTKRYKWNAWKKLVNKSQKEAKIGYIRIAIDILTPFLSIPEKKSEKIEENIKYLSKIDEIDYVKLKTPLVVYVRDLTVANENRYEFLIRLAPLIVMKPKPKRWIYLLILVLIFLSYTYKIRKRKLI